jgi:serine/threonine protein kinase
MSTPTTLVADRYRLVKMLGAGGMGVVWQAWDERLQRPVALKLLRTQPALPDAERDQATARAMREARITAGLHHPHAVTVFDVVEHEGQPCLVMQLIESTPLSDLLSEHGTLTPSETARIGAQVGSALAAAHKMRIVHRDVKPGNILIAEDGSALISDFGISHALGDTTITATGMIHGTPAYLAPEVARGLPTSFASDVFSLGSTLYAMLEGTPPFGTENNAIALLHKVARGGYPAPRHAGPLAPLLRSMLSADPKRRPSMESVVESLKAADDGNGAVVAAAALPWPFDELAENADEVPTEPLEGTPPDSGTLPLATVVAAAQTRPAPGPTAETVRVDPSAARESPTAETEPLARSDPYRPAPTERMPAPTPEPRRRGRRAAITLGILSIVGVLVVVALLLWNPWRSNLDGAAQPEPSASGNRSPAAETPAATPAPSEPAATSPPADAAEPAPPTPEQGPAETVSKYYALLPSDLDAAWPLMTADYQENHAGGRDAYNAFWAAVESVEVAEVSAPAPDQVQATLIYHYWDGSVVQEVTAYRLVEEAGVLKIAASEVISSS